MVHLPTRALDKQEGRASLETVARRRLRVRCRGAVQGVGFRPAVYRIAKSMNLDGWVLNDPDGVLLEVEGTGQEAERFIKRLSEEVPPLARLDEIESETVEPHPGDTGFEVLDSEHGRRERALVPPDAPLCDACRQDMESATDRRYRYPFTTCTDCGPRFSLVRSLPYDRKKTSMACFPLCEECAAEYADPGDRRFHAEPVCCPACGPQLRGVDTRDGSASVVGVQALGVARIALDAGRVVAVKGLGGFQLACRADDESAVQRLRSLKRRPAKPFAVMARDLPTARQLVVLAEQDEALLLSPRSPILLAPRRVGAPAASSVAPGLDDIGVMLPTTPLHVELFRGLASRVLVMTSANATDEPIVCGNREAIDRLSGIADFILYHNRDIVRRVDDSVARATPCGPMLLRRARGWVPEPLPLPQPAREPILSLGGHLQVTACLAVGSEAFPSQHVGDLDSVLARRFHEEVIAGLEQFLEVAPSVIAVDAHPDYPSSILGRRLANERDAQLLQVQHHVAHAAAVLGEHSQFPAEGESVAALVLDGTGWGPDGTAWGGELLRLNGDLSWSRLGNLEPMPLIGGEVAVREPWRCAVALLMMANCEPLLSAVPLGSALDPARLAAVSGMATTGRWPLASGAGRLFEAAGALFGLATVNRYEGEAAMRFESLAAKAQPTTPWQEVRVLEGGRSPLIPSAELLAAAARRLADGENPAQTAADFHATFCSLAAALTRSCLDSSTRTVALAGGCLVNRLLLEGMTRSLRSAGCRPLLPRNIPPGDGGLSYGQAVVAAVASARGQILRQEQDRCA